MPRRTKSSGKTTKNISVNHDYLLVYEKIKNKNRLVINVILSIFTAISFAKTIKEFLDGGQSARNWIIFASAIVVAVGIIIVNYMIDNKK